MKFLDNIDAELGPYFEQRSKSIFPAQALDAASNVVLRGEASFDEHGVFWPSEYATSKIGKDKVAFVRFQHGLVIPISGFEQCPTELGVHFHFRAPAFTPRGACH